MYSITVLIVAVPFIGATMQLSALAPKMWAKVGAVATAMGVTYGTVNYYATNLLGDYTVFTCEDFLGALCDWHCIVAVGCGLAITIYRAANFLGQRHHSHVGRAIAYVGAAARSIPRDVPLPTPVDSVRTWTLTKYRAKRDKWITCVEIALLLLSLSTITVAAPYLDTIHLMKGGLNPKTIADVNRFFHRIPGQSVGNPQRRAFLIKEGLPDVKQVAKSTVGAGSSHSITTPELVAHFDAILKLEEELTHTTKIDPRAKYNADIEAAIAYLAQSLEERKAVSHVDDAITSESLNGLYTALQSNLLIRFERYLRARNVAAIKEVMSTYSSLRRLTVDSGSTHRSLSLETSLLSICKELGTTACDPFVGAVMQEIDRADLNVENERFACTVIQHITDLAVVSNPEGQIVEVARARGRFMLENWQRWIYGKDLPHLQKHIKEALDSPDFPRSEWPGIPSINSNPFPIPTYLSQSKEVMDRCIAQRRSLNACDLEDEDAAGRALVLKFHLHVRRRLLARWNGIKHDYVGEPALKKFNAAISSYLQSSVKAMEARIEGDLETYQKENGLASAALGRADKLHETITLDLAPNGEANQKDIKSNDSAPGK